MSNSQSQPTNRAAHEFSKRFNSLVPLILAVMVAISGLTVIYPLLHRVLVGEHLQWLGHQSWREVIQAIGLIELPRVFIGVCLILMSVGLAMRARLAWAFSLIVFVPALAVTIYSDWGITSAKIIYDFVVVVLLIRYWSRFNRSSLTAGTLFAVGSLVSLNWYAMLGSLYLGDQFNPMINELPEAAYFSIVAMSTVGFGDIVPVTHTSRFFVMSVIVFGITVFATSLGAVIGPVVNGKLRHMFRYKARKSLRKNHVILCGTTPLALSLYRSLTERGELVTVVLRPGTKHDYPDSADIVFGDAFGSDTLSEAGVEDASHVLALRADDPDNAFIVLAVKSFPNSKARTIVLVNNSENLEKIRRVDADVVFSPELLSAELLARAMTGEVLDKNLISELFFAKPLDPAADNRN